MKVWFDEQEVNWGPDKNGKPTKGETVVMFHLSRPATGNPGCGPTTFDGRATEEHKERYKDAYEAFLKSKEPKKLVAPKHAEKIVEEKK